MFSTNYNLSAIKSKSEINIPYEIHVFSFLFSSVIMNNTKNNLFIKFTPTLSTTHIMQLECIFNVVASGLSAPKGAKF